MQQNPGTYNAWSMHRGPFILMNMVKILSLPYDSSDLTNPLVQFCNCSEEQHSI